MPIFYLIFTLYFYFILLLLQPFCDSKIEEKRKSMYLTNNKGGARSEVFEVAKRVECSEAFRDWMG